MCSQNDRDIWKKNLLGSNCLVKFSHMEVFSIRNIWKNSSWETFPGAAHSNSVDTWYTLSILPISTKINVPVAVQTPYLLPLLDRLGSQPSDQIIIYIKILGIWFPFPLLKCTCGIRPFFSKYTSLEINDFYRQSDCSCTCKNCGCNKQEGCCKSSGSGAACVLHYIVPIVVAGALGFIMGRKCK